MGKKSTGKFHITFCFSMCVTALCIYTNNRQQTIPIGAPKDCFDGKLVRKEKQVYKLSDLYEKNYIRVFRQRQRSFVLAAGKIGFEDILQWIIEHQK